MSQLQQPHRVVTAQQNEMHQPQQQHQQQTLHMYANDIISIQSDFSTLYHPDKKIDKQIETKYDILFSCLEADKEWKLVKKDSGGTVLVRHGTNSDDLENLAEGEAYINSYAYGHRKSDETLECCNELYLKYVLGTEMGRRLIQQHISSLTSSSTPTPKVDQEGKELAARTLNFMMGDLSIADRTPLQQNEEAIAAAKLLLEQLETNREMLLRQESKKRQLEFYEVEQPRHPSVNDNTKEKKQRTEKEEDDLVDNSSINTAQDAEFETSMDMESDNESESMVVLNNTDVSVSNCRDKEEQEPRDNGTAKEIDIDAPTPPQDSTQLVDTHTNIDSPLTNADSSNEEEGDDDESDCSSDGCDDSVTGDDDSVADDPLGGWNGCGRTKEKLFFQPLLQIESMTGVVDTSPSATERLGDIFQSQYAKVQDALKKYSALKSENSPEFIDTPEFKSICEETARLIKNEFPGYTGELCDFVELLLLGRVSPRTEHLNTGKTQGARMLVDAKLREEKDHFNHQVLLHPKFFLERAHDRRLMEECPSLHEAIKAAHYSSSKEVHLFVNDSLRYFYESIQHRFLLEVLKALNPNKVIVIRLCRNGLMSTDKNDEVIQLVNTCELGLKALRKEISHKSPSKNVPVTKLEDPKQADIDERANERRAEWKAANRYPDPVKNAFKAGQAYTPSKNHGPGFRQMVKDTKSQLQLDVPEPPLYYDKSNTEKGSSIVHNGHVNFFGRQTEGHQVSDDIAALIRTSRRAAEVDMDGMPVECIGSVASIVAYIELRKEQGLLPKKAELKYIFYGRDRSRSAIVSDHDNKLLDAILTNEIGHVCTTTPNRINKDPIVVQTYVGPVEFHCSKDSGKEIGPILRKEEERNVRHQVITNTCKTAVVAVENDCDDVRSDPSFHNLLKKVSKSCMPKRFVEQAEEYNSTTSYATPLFALSSLELQCQKQLEECNDKAKTYLEHPKAKKTGGDVKSNTKKVGKKRKVHLGKRKVPFDPFVDTGGRIVLSTATQSTKRSYIDPRKEEKRKKKEEQKNDADVEERA